MKRIVILNIIWIFLFSCSGQIKRQGYNPKAIELQNRATKLRMSQDYDSALVLLNKATELDQDFYKAYGSKTRIYCILKKYEKALIESEILIKVKPDLAEGWVFAGMLSDKLGDTIKAKYYYEKSIEIYDDMIMNPDEKKDEEINRIFKAFSMILLGHEEDGKNELRKLRIDNPDSLSIDEYLMVSKQDIINIALTGNE
jgi:tetratricopeptide (TPR) repeat protein